MADHDVEDQHEPVATLNNAEDMAEGEENGAPVVDKKPPGKFYDTSVDAEETGSKKALYGVLFLLALVAILLVAALLFRVDDSPLERAIVIPNTTEAPTLSPEEGITLAPTTKSPTPLPTTEAPTPEPTPLPTTITTAPPTFGPETPIPISRQDCYTIRNFNKNVTGGGRAGNNFNNFTMWDGHEICADTFGGFDRTFPQRSVWASDIGRRDCVLFNWADGKDICDLGGARRCTADELQQGAALGTGCGGDFELLYSSTSCTTDDNKAGKLLVNFALRQEGVVFFECEPNFNTRKTITRCCGDLVI